MTAATREPVAPVRAERPSAPPAIDRLTPQVRPSAPVVATQRWHSALLLHWALPPEALKRHLPKRLTIDTHQGEAWVSALLFTVTGARVRPLPPLPFVSSFHEVKLRTYVHLDGKDPGVWHFACDATSVVACVLGRAALRLPYHLARQRRAQIREEHRYDSTRVTLRRPPVELSVSWRSSGALIEAGAGSLEHFLTQRFFVYSPSAAGRLWCQPLHHKEWPLFPAELLELRQTLDEAHQLPFLPKHPTAHYSPGVDVEFFPPRLV